MKAKSDTLWLEKNTLIRVDAPSGYENSGIIAVLQDGKIGFFQFGHCSCSGTWNDRGWDDDKSGTYSVDWVGSPDELVEGAKNKTDYCLPGRKREAGDFDAGMWNKFDELVLLWDSEGRPKKVYEHSLGPRY